MGVPERDPGRVPDPERAQEDTFIPGINDNPLIAIKDRLINAFRFILKGLE